jgi:hypothetical protein
MSGVDIDSVAEELLAAYRTGKTLDSGRPRNREDAVSSPPCGSPSRAPTPFPGSRYRAGRSAFDRSGGRVGVAVPWS